MPKRRTVTRITVDEILDRTLIRLLTTPLLSGITAITDSDEEWGEEKESLVSPAQALVMLGLDRADARRIAELFLGDAAAARCESDLLAGRPDQLLLRFLEEGQVFVRGHFAVEGDRMNPTALTVTDGPVDTLRLDHMPLVKDRSKRLYATALAAGARRGRR